MPNLPTVYSEQDDFTVYFENDKVHQKKYLSDSESSRDLVLDLGNTGIRGRGLACRCNDAKHISITVRPERRIREGSGIKHPDVTATGIQSLLNESKFKPSKECPKRFKVSTDGLCEVLYKQIFAKETRSIPSGLVVVGGQTASAKSQTVRGLIYRLLTDDILLKTWCQAKNDRRPHLVTLEDPIEKTLMGVSAGSPPNSDPFDIGIANNRDRLIDYTPRNRSTNDYESLAEAFADALRQSPTVVYVGEVRTKDDWKAIIDFAGTGHLVITTTHAGSVTEIIAKMIDATKATEPEALGRLAQRILAVVHQAPLECDGGVALIPTIWRKTAAGIAGLISEGLSSVLPHFPQTEGDLKRRSSLGRRWAVKELLQHSKDEGMAQLFPEFDGHAFSMDLMGM